MFKAAFILHTLQNASNLRTKKDDRPHKTSTNGLTHVTDHFTGYFPAAHIQEQPASRGLGAVSTRIISASFY
jgi:hypothetical protein